YRLDSVVRGPVPVRRSYRPGVEPDEHPHDLPHYDELEGDREVFPEHCGLRIPKLRVRAEVTVEEVRHVVVELLPEGKVEPVFLDRQLQYDRRGAGVWSVDPRELDGRGEDYVQQQEDEQDEKD